MKLNAKKMTLSLLVIGLLSSHYSIAADEAPKAEAVKKPSRIGRVVRTGSSGSSTPGTGSSNQGGGNTTIQGPGTRIDTGHVKQESCPDITNSEALSMEFLKKLMADENAPFKMEITESGKFRYEIPRYYKACGMIVPVLSPIAGTTDYSVSIVMTKDGTNQTHDQILDCLAKNDKFDKDGNLDFSKTEYGEYSPKTISPESNPVPGFKKSVSSKLVVKWPLDFDANDNYPPTKPSLKDLKGVSKDDLACYSYHGSDSVQGYLTERDQWLARVFDACKNGSAKQLDEVRKSVKSAKVLSDMMDKISQILDGQYISKALASAKTDYLEKLDDIEKNFKSGSYKTRNHMVAASNDYLSILKKMDNDLVGPIQARILELEALPSSEKDKKISDEIALLKEGLASLDRKKSGEYNTLMVALRENGIGPQAKEIRVLVEKVGLYDKFNQGQGGKNFAKIADRLKVFERKVVEETNLWSDVYAVKNGDKEPIERKYRAIVGEYKVIQGAQKQTQERMQKKIQSGCSGFYTQQGCLKAQQEAYKERQRYEAFVSKRGPRVQDLMSQYNGLRLQEAKYNELQGEAEDDSYLSSLGLEDPSEAWSQLSAKDLPASFNIAGQGQMQGQGGHNFAGMSAAGGGVPMLGTQYNPANFGMQNAGMPMMMQGQGGQMVMPGQYQIQQNQFGPAGYVPF